MSTQLISAGQFCAAEFFILLSSSRRRLRSDDCLIFLNLYHFVFRFLYVFCDVFIVVSFVVSASATDSLQRLVSDMTCYMS